MKKNFEKPEINFYKVKNYGIMCASNVDGDGSANGLSSNDDIEAGN